MIAIPLTNDECQQIIQKFVGDKSDANVKVIDYRLTKYSDGYPGFLGEYFSLKIRFSDVSNKNIEALIECFQFL